MKHIFLCMSICCAAIPSFAQLLQGTVYDAKTKETLPGVAIFLDGTSIVTTSDNDGKFLLEVGKIINAHLVFRHLSYESLIIEKPFEYQKEAFFLVEKTNLINEARVVADFDPLSRSEKMRIFKEFFLGTSVAAKSCVIFNEDDIVLRYDYKADMLYASAANPLIVENRYLGYGMEIDIKYFQVEFAYSNAVSPGSSKNNFISTPFSFSYRITSFFEDHSPYNISIISRRNEIYERSRACFWSSMINNFSIEASGFKIFNRFKAVRAKDYFVVIDNPIQKIKEVLIIPETDINRKHNEVSKGDIYGVIGIRTQKNVASEVIFLTNRFSVDHFGNVATGGLFYRGDMALQRVGDMMPLDYVYTPSKAPRRR